MATTGFAWKWSAQCWLIAFVIVLGLDAIWLSVMGPRAYAPAFRKITKSRSIHFSIAYGFIAWALLAGAVVHCSWRNTAKSAFYGAMAGFVIYGVYNSTMLATLSEYPMSLAVVDTLWGTFALSVAATLCSVCMYRRG